MRLSLGFEIIEELLRKVELSIEVLNCELRKGWECEYEVVWGEEDVKEGEEEEEEEEDIVKEEEEDVVEEEEEECLILYRSLSFSIADCNLE